MKITITDLSGLPEGLKSVVETEGDKATLDLSKLMPAEDLTGLKSALQKERGNASAYAKFGTPEELDAKLADLEKKAQGTGKAAEDAQAKIDQIKAEYEDKLTGANSRIETMMKANASASLKAELAKAGFIPEAIDDIAATALGRLEFGDDGTPKVLTADGKPMIGNGADHGATLGDLAKELADAKPYAVRDGGKGGGGKQPNSGGTPQKKWAEMTSGEKVRLHRENPEEYERVKAAG
ncbi:hypothetical protein [Phaeobacter sp. S60]|uniref:hypothetical protein n=1 Tax=Phaeobacter sp. S60 TaxID=1569353 RepID=UPI000590DB3F|nr:hypothetical protein [Phaeobacter sp. S60]KII11760.1 hypothetical protein OO25_19635 [Phaeobacter sp. S60]